MKKSSSSEQHRMRQPGVGRVLQARTQKIAAAPGIKLTPARKAGPVHLLEEQFIDPDTQWVSLEYFNPTAREVQVAGSFNNWQAQATPMARQDGGNWTAGLRLKPGPYEYRLVVDGQWQDDPMAAHFVSNPYGGLNGVLEVKPPETKQN